MRLITDCRLASMVEGGAAYGAVDLTEYDPSLEIGDLSSLTAGRWFCELLAGFESR